MIYLYDDAAQCVVSCTAHRYGDFRTTRRITESRKWDVGHGGISPYLNRLPKDHNKESNRYLTPSELLKGEPASKSKDM